MQKKKIEEIVNSMYSKKEEKESKELTNKLIQSLLNFSMILALLSIIYFFSFPKEGYYTFPLSNLGFSPLFGLIFFLIFIFVLYYILPKTKKS
ncbi:MAG: hypothetical protein QXQ14_02255 [Candidatus Aenigmatarchaeota archaeon]